MLNRYHFALSFCQANNAINKVFEGYPSSVSTVDTANP